MRHLAYALAVFSLCLGACAADAGDGADESEGVEATRSGARAIAEPGGPKTDAPTTGRDRSRNGGSGSSDNTKPQTDPWSPVPDDNLKQRPQTDPWSPTPDGTTGAAIVR
jgi:hypothetical protein